jgi:quercetin dioxygenase-like cupin family protein
MPVMSGFGALARLPWDRINDKIERRILAGKQGMIVWWKMKAGAHAASHQHPHEQIVWMLSGRMDFRIGSDRRSTISGDVAVIPGNLEHEGFFPEDTEVVDVFAPPLAILSGIAAQVFFVLHHISTRTKPVIVGAAMSGCSTRKA